MFILDCFSVSTLAKRRMIHLRREHLGKMVATTLSVSSPPFQHLHSLLDWMSHSCSHKPVGQFIGDSLLQEPWSVGLGLQFEVSSSRIHRLIEHHWVRQPVKTCEGHASRPTKFLQISRWDVFRIVFYSTCFWQIWIMFLDFIMWTKDFDICIVPFYGQFGVGSWNG